jgi:hypothetical protein
MRWWLREARLPRERRGAARAERRAEAARYADDRDDRIADRARAEFEGQHSRGADFHRG